MDYYVSQLQAMFRSCDPEERGYLEREGLVALCDKLQLEEHTGDLVSHLLALSPQVTFELFKDAFINLLTNTYEESQMSPVAPEPIDQQPSLEWGEQEEREVSPKFVLGEKQYGRKSRPIDESPAHHKVEDQQQQDVNTTGCEAYLRAVWQRVGLAEHLDLEGLASVCRHIGMDMTQQMVGRLFDKLDTDQDGQVSFEELLQGLFQHRMTEPPGSPEKFAAETPAVNSSTQPPLLLFSPDLPRTCSPARLLEYWESLGFSHGALVLEKLGMGHCSEICLQTLSQTLEEELNSIQPVGVLAQCALTSFLHAHRLIRAQAEQLHCECEALRCGLSEANNRTQLLVQEVDDHQAAMEAAARQQLEVMERKHQEQVRQLESELQQEKESAAAQLARELSTRQEEVSLLQHRMVAQHNENIQLQKEIQETTERLEQAERSHNREREAMNELQERLSELEQTQAQPDLGGQLQEQLIHNKQLQDLVDELTQELSLVRNHHPPCWGQESSPSECSSTEGPMTGDWIQGALQGLRPCPALLPLYQALGGRQAEDLRQALGALNSQLRIGINPGPTDVLVKELYVENCRLERELERAESGQRRAELNASRLMAKCRVLSRLVGDVARRSSR